MSSARRRYADGGISKRVKNGKTYFVARVSGGIDPQGKRVRPEVWCTSEAEALREKRKLERELETGILRAAPRGDDNRLADYLKRWVHSLNLAPSTILRYKQTINVDLIPIVGRAYIADFDAAKGGIKRVLAIEKRMRDDGASDDKITKAHATLSAALSDAVPEHIQFNPCTAMPKRLKPKQSTPKRIVYERSEVDVLLAACVGHRIEALVVVALFTEMREGELFALAKRNVDVAGGMIRVEAGLQDVSMSKRAIGTTKTRAGRRTIQLNTIAAEALARHLAHAVEQYGETFSPLVFHDERGGPIRRSNFLRRDFYPLLERAGLRRIHFHDLRHTGATLIAPHVSPFALKQRLGDASSAMADHYGGHYNRESDRAVVDALNQLFPSKRGESGGDS